MSCNHRVSLWSRRTVIQAGVAGLAAAAVNREAWGAEELTLASTICIDADVAFSEVARKSKVAAALRQFSERKGEVPIDDHVAPSVARGLSMAPKDPSSAAPTGPSKAAFQNKWDLKTLKVHFLSGFNVTPKLRDTVMDQIKEWSKACDIKFDKADSIAASQVRVGFAPGKGHFSTVGIDANLRSNAQTMNLDMDNNTIDLQYNLGVILHEFGHAMGMIHEHQNPSSELDFLPATNPKMLKYFGDRGLRDPQVIQDNIVKRYSASQMLKFSKFDPLSIMLYAFPAELTKNNKGTEQNTVLSETDKRYAALLYGPSPNGTSISEETPPPLKEVSITVDGAAGEGKLVAGGAVEVKLSVPSGDKEIAIYTTGTTRLMMLLSDSAGKDLTPKNPKRHGTPDLMNEAIILKLPAGDYKVTITHPSARGGGMFKIQATTEPFKKYLTEPNEKQ